MQEPITFTGSPLDRAGNLRRDGNWLAAHLADSSSRFLPFHRLRALIRLEGAAAIGWKSRAEVADFLDAGAICVFLGMQGDIAHFGVDVSAIDKPKAEPYAAWGKFIDVRSIAASLPAGHAAILAQARAMIDWHARHGFCAVCGEQSVIAEAGYVRRCSDDGCKAMHFPRTDPVVIMLVESGEDCLLGRQPRFDKEVFSALAGFMEPGESIEEAVRREILEEAGITVGAVRYLASQHWPFPSSLMIGCVGVAETREITLDPQELEEARWFRRSEIAEMIENATIGKGLRMPPALSLAHQLALRWLAGTAESTA